VAEDTPPVDETPVDNELDVNIYATDLDGNRTEVVETSNGFGVSSPGDRISQLEFDASTGRSESIVVELDRDAEGVSFDVTRLFENENRDGLSGTDESGRYTLFKDGEAVGTGTFSGSGTSASVSVQSDVPFDKIVFEATDFTDQGSDTDANGTVIEVGADRTDSSDFYIDNVSFDLVDDSNSEIAEALSGKSKLTLSI